MKLYQLVPHWKRMQMKEVLKNLKQETFIHEALLNNNRNVTKCGEKQENCRT
jgi:hypothetical protein